jgi:hypothetical protein
MFANLSNLMDLFCPTAASEDEDSEEEDDEDGEEDDGNDMDSDED